MSAFGVSFVSVPKEDVGDRRRLWETQGGLGKAFLPMPNPRIAIIKWYAFAEFFGRIKALNTTLDFGWISSGKRGTHLKIFWGGLFW